jgi:nucleoid-associated protein YgaU
MSVMRTDVKVGLFLGIAALLLAGWMYWPAATNKTVPVGDLSRPVTVTFDAPGRTGTPRGTSTVEPLTAPPANTGTAVVTPSPAPLTAPPSSPGLFFPRTAEANVPVQPTEPVTAPPVPPPPSMMPVADAGSAVDSAPAPAGAVPSLVANPAPVASASPEVAGAATIGRESLLHVVKSGQTLERIAEEYYREDGRFYDPKAMVNLLQQANPQLANGKQLRAGTKIRIPDPATPLAQSVPASPTSAAPNPAVPSLATVTTPVMSPTTPSASVPVAGGREYKVQRGDTLYSIATKQLGNPQRWQEVLDLNNTTLGGKPQGLRPGQVLRLPS